MAQWEPQIRTNLEDDVYRAQLDDLLSKIPGALGAGLVNLRFREGCLRLPGGRAAADAELQGMIALSAGLFGGHAGTGGSGGPNGESDPAFAAALAALQPFASAYLSLHEETVLLSRLSDAAGGAAGSPGSPGIAGDAGQPERVLFVTVSPNLNQGTATNLRRMLTDRLAGGGAGVPNIAPLLESTNDVLQGAVIDVASGAVMERYERFQGASAVALDDALVEMLRALFTAGGAARGLSLRHRDGRQLTVRRAELATATRSLHWARIRFDPEHLLVLSADRRVVPGLLSIMMRNCETETVRIWVDGLLSYGVESTMSPFPATQTEFLDIVRQLRRLDENDLLGRLNIGGFANYTVGEGDDMQRCQECIYYLPNSRWCDIPELPVPVEAHWWCRLWKM